MLNRDFQRIIAGDPKRDKEISSDKSVIRRTLDELGIKDGDVTEPQFKIPEQVNILFLVRYNLEKELRRIR